MARVLLLAKLTPQSGNKTTAERIKCHLLQYGNICELESTTIFESAAELRDYLIQKEIQCIIGIHLWRAGRHLLECPLPFSLIFGGTDINEHFKDNAKMKVMTKVVKQSKNLIAFSHIMASKANELWPGIESKIIVQPQAGCVQPSEFSGKEMIKIMKEFANSADKIRLQTTAAGSLVLFLLIAGLRPVKDPMFLFHVMSEWHKDDPTVYYVVVGPELDPEFSKQVKLTAQQYPGIVVIPALVQCDLHGAVKHCATAVVNSSSSEGMAASLLEKRLAGCVMMCPTSDITGGAHHTLLNPFLQAMALGTAVLARRIPGNETLITHNENGLLFDSPQEFLSLAKDLVSSPEQRHRLVSGGKRYVANNHSINNEKETYGKVVRALIEN